MESQEVAHRWGTRSPKFERHWGPRSGSPPEFQKVVKLGRPRPPLVRQTGGSKLPTDAVGELLPPVYNQHQKLNTTVRNLGEARLLSSQVFDGKARQEVRGPKQRPMVVLDLRPPLAISQSV